jgi:uncharacterized repeat protein (TIGR01451 family)
LSFDVTIGGLSAGPATINNTATASAGNAASQTANAPANASAQPLLTLHAVVAGLTQSGVSCGSVTGGAVCPSSPTPAQLRAGLAIPTLPSGGSVTFLAQATVTAASGTVSNTATIATPVGTNDPNAANNQATDTDTVVAVASNADLSVTKSGAASVLSGTTTTYTIVVSNAGPQAADGAILSDPAVAGLSKTSVICGSSSGGAQCPTNPTVAQLQSGIAIPRSVGPACARVGV